LDSSHGTVCLIAVPEQVGRECLVEALLRNCEDYLRNRGAERLYVGEVGPWPPFYYGLFGGFRGPAVMDPGIVRVLLRNGYTSYCEHWLFRLDLTQYTAPLDDILSGLSSRVVVQPETGVSQNWWAASCLAYYQDVDFVGREIPSDRVVARLKLRTVDPNRNPVNTAGVASLQITSDWGNQGLDSFVLFRAIQWLRANDSGDFRGCRLLEAQVDSTAPALIAACRFHRFQESPGGFTFCKTARMQTA